MDLIGFDGQLSLIFFILEFLLLLLLFSKARDYQHFWNTISVLILLQLYQLAEFIVCRYGIAMVAQLAFVIITFLPPAGYHLATQLTTWKKRDYLLGYGLATIFALYYLFEDNAVIVHECNPYYAVYYFKAAYLYAIYYNLFLLYAMIFLLIQLRNMAERGSAIILLIGYISFMLPMLLMVLIDISWLMMVTSVMCKFAIMLAATLGILMYSR
ncbi:MAG: hypothetical protein INQ03_05390 [Candidatus Heimdallarchaeota archaeon]|nr:hypothetical protein [Candidatus Heimdallarchaeota archaeon]